VQYVLVFIGCVLVVDAVVGEKGLLAMMKARQEYRALERSLAAARVENTQLREDARRLREDASAIEDLARRELGLIRPGEKLFIVRDVRPARE
jgi:cell division protein FtsB